MGIGSNFEQLWVFSIRKIGENTLKIELEEQATRKGTKQRRGWTLYFI